MDLLRSIAILLVVLAHAVLSFGAPSYLAPLQYGGTGVDLFFVLSGWLLGGQLFREVDKTGRVDVRKFWARRWMRTLPAYYAVLIASLLQRYFTKDGVRFPWEYFFFLQNYNHPLEFFSISWSLCVEEQFYLFIAPLVAFSVFLKSKSTTALLVFILLMPLIFRLLGLYSNIEETHVRVDGCVMGVLLANIRSQHQPTWNALVKNAPFLALVGLLCYILIYVARYYGWQNLSNPDKLLLALIFASWVLVANSNSGWQKMLYVPGAYFVATRSYALYLIHPEVLALLRRVAEYLPFPAYLLLALVGSLLAAEVLFRLVEKPVMDARERFKFSRSAS